MRISHSSIAPLLLVLRRSVSEPDAEPELTKVKEQGRRKTIA